MRRALLLSCTLAILALAAPVHAQEAAWGEDIEVMSEADMGAARGGFMVMPGVQLNFGAMVTTYVNGAPALATQLTWTDTGAVVERSIGELGQRIDALSPAQRDELGLGGLEGAGGVVIADAAGVTALVHNITDGVLQNIIVNTASGRTLSQNIDVTLTLPGFEAVQAGLMFERIGMRLDEDMRGIAFGPPGG
ncbi:MAG: hypothetical protein KF700_01285 [Hyphomonadaceae bacterium]|nr:hypothetical protein [Hyphomonadaceae bacterium]